MEPLKTVGIKNLKNNLSAYLRDLKRGSRILVTDRDEVVAELREPFASPLEGTSHPLRMQWIRAGKIRPPLRSKGMLPQSELHYPPGTALGLLDRDRSD